MNDEVLESFHEFMAKFGISSSFEKSFSRETQKARLWTRYVTIYNLINNSLRLLFTRQDSEFQCLRPTVE